MRKTMFAVAVAVFAAGPVLAQTPAPTGATGGVQRPIDLGPNTPAANGAYQGGGVVLQGAPGAPPPPVQPTPPGQTPAGAVSK